MEFPLFHFVKNYLLTTKNKLLYAFKRFFKRGRS
jgi:hypothetical protein